MRPPLRRKASPDESKLTETTKGLHLMSYDDEWGDWEGPRFAGPSTALRAASKRNPRNLPCPTCRAPNRLTPADRAQGYQCDACADRDEGGGY
jgi:hypothetical protein